MSSDQLSAILKQLGFAVFTIDGSHESFLLLILPDRNSGHLRNYYETLETHFNIIDSEASPAFDKFWISRIPKEETP